MYAVIKLTTHGEMSDVGEVFGPFDTLVEAQAFADKRMARRHPRYTYEPIQMSAVPIREEW